ncbi:MAG: hypothetical protein GY745_16990, partial [Actinomycetia bacterium]|nr:hypothetical protein [Actinomycetes bacterium]
RLFGSSLDNTVRFIDRADTPGDPEWVLADLQVERAAHGVGHGTGHLWSEDGRQLGIALDQGAGVLHHARGNARGLEDLGPLLGLDSFRPLGHSVDPTGRQERA